MTGDTDEVNFWDFRNLAKSLYSIKTGASYQTEFSLATSNQIIMSRDTSVVYLSLADYKQNESIETNGIKES